MASRLSSFLDDLPQPSPDKPRTSLSAWGRSDADSENGADTGNNGVLGILGDDLELDFDLTDDDASQCTNEDDAKSTASSLDRNPSAALSGVSSAHTANPIPPEEKPPKAPTATRRPPTHSTPMKLPGTKDSADPDPLALNLMMTPVGGPSAVTFTAFGFSPLSQATAESEKDDASTSVPPVDNVPAELQESKGSDNETDDNEEEEEEFTVAGVKASAPTPPPPPPRAPSTDTVPVDDNPTATVAAAAAVGTVPPPPTALPTTIVFVDSDEDQPKSEEGEAEDAAPPPAVTTNDVDVDIGDDDEFTVTVQDTTPSTTIPKTSSRRVTVPKDNSLKVTRRSDAGSRLKPSTSSSSSTTSTTGSRIPRKSRASVTGSNGTTKPPVSPQKKGRRKKSVKKASAKTQPTRPTIDTAPDTTTTTTTAATAPAPPTLTEEGKSIRSQIEKRLNAKWDNEPRLEIEISEDLLFRPESRRDATPGKPCPEAEVVERELILHEPSFGLKLRPGEERDNLPLDAVVAGIHPKSPCTGFVGVGDQLVALNGYRITGLSHRVIVFLLKEVQKTTSSTTATALRFRSVSNGLAPRVLGNALSEKGVPKIPESLLPLLQGNSCTSVPTRKGYVEPKVQVHFTPGPSVEPPAVTVSESTAATYVDVTFTRTPLGIFFAQGRAARKVRGTTPGSEASISLQLDDTLVAVNGISVLRWGVGQLGRMLKQETAGVSPSKPKVLRFLRPKPTPQSRSTRQKNAIEQRELEAQVKAAWRPTFHAPSGPGDDSCLCIECRGSGDDGSTLSIVSPKTLSPQKAMFDAGVVIPSSELKHDGVRSNARTPGAGAGAGAGAGTGSGSGSGPTEGLGVVEFLEKEIVVNQPMIGLTFEYGVKWRGRKYDAVLKRIKETSPYVDELRCGDRLVAVNGARVSEATGHQRFGALMKQLDQLLSTCKTAPFSLTFRTTKHSEDTARDAIPASPCYRFMRRRRSSGPTPLVFALVSHRRADIGMLIDVTFIGTPVGIVIKNRSVESTHVGSIGSHIVRPGDLVHAVNGILAKSFSVEEVQELLRKAHDNLKTPNNPQTMSFLRVDDKPPSRLSGLQLRDDSSDEEGDDDDEGSECALDDLLAAVKEAGSLEEETEAESGEAEEKARDGETVADADAEAGAGARPRRLSTPSLPEDLNTFQRVFVGFVDPPDGIAFASQGNSRGARVAFCRGGTDVAQYVQRDDTLVSVDGQDVAELPTAEVKHILARPSRSRAPLRVLEFAPSGVKVMRRPRRSSVHDRRRRKSSIASV